MKFTRLEIPDIILIEPKVFEDPRGFFFEFYNEKVFSQNGIHVKFIQDNYSRSSKGVLRGLHWQAEPTAQDKLVRVAKGEVFDVAVDIRKNSPTFGSYVGIYLSETNKKMLFVPKGFAHGYCVVSAVAEFFYKVSNFYSPVDERGIIWNDPTIHIEWPKLDMDYILSERDKKYSPLK
ncbi:MAG: dTDP-4-dehydrorhamnose 3,5-epimerase [Omnitrophica bacterium RIFCSPLOWO2_12_FULL_44_17]|uniref:dTDP-4-dehydrorhamnose 3,5-epimerase n=1 Tax=Candidatus Danuiimicrobium aquiferis TaxID=1801832 RepID=A0A1G1KX92_9BACT|nr:MAG: dTDP-4-dehydrorhamnose 3,5-epimerase [Omnitrophica bacterium RIFCSPHIGHO2_02_FULL_45_28]OGW90977.1 MAG: dTDP-4-dehydrorhamnose 3,5-epimerase [Omnitrophica bacterium RIFCSPHIGHO2_12_FULL_44_12]OGW97548.1 MAG: dTDP-4-dehydrorhamnose 3,5-epimerase [Omnitrophica bacterium RIFCSPLOWO2_12_FULL_44_17]OGX02100.1 MAG: dTDP-4-dehydrorhamnose 3,5-epimerase [Omnitrophica bacterium RIFCSPLOWO2_02_FULL_44_11]